MNHKTLDEILNQFGRRAIGAARNLYISEEEAKQDAQEAIAKELMGCLPERFEPEMDSEGDKYLTDTKDGYNRCLDEVRARLTAFIGKGEK